MLTSAHPHTVLNSKKTDKDGNIIFKNPSCILHYNHSMGGADLLDQQLDSRLLLRKCYNWYKKLFLRLILQCALSAHKLYKLKGSTSYTSCTMCVTIWWWSRQKWTKQSKSSITCGVSRGIITFQESVPAKELARKRQLKSNNAEFAICYARVLCTAKGKPITTTRILQRMSLTTWFMCWNWLFWRRSYQSRLFMCVTAA